MIKIELDYDPEQYTFISSTIMEPKENSSNLSMYKLTFGSNYPEVKAIYKKAKEYVPNFLDPLLNLYEEINPKYRGKAVIFDKLIGAYKLHKFLAETTTKKERTFVLNEIKKKAIDSNKFEFFMYSLKKIAEIYSEGHKKVSTLEDHYLSIKRGLLNKNFTSSVEYHSCGDPTDIGFFHSFSEGKIFTAKIKIDGEYRRIFVKTPMHHGIGYNPMFLDAKTLDVYAFKTNNLGKITSYTIRIKHNPLDTRRERFLRTGIDRYTKKTIENQKAYREELSLNKFLKKNELTPKRTKEIIKRIRTRLK